MVSKTAIVILANEINHKETEKQNLEETNEQIKEQIENLSAENTYLQLKMIDNKDQRIIEFNRMLRNTIPNAEGYQNDEEEKKVFRRIKDFIDYVKANERNQKHVLDIRNWHSFAASELSLRMEVKKIITVIVIV